MYKAVIIRLFPNKHQEPLLRRFAGAARWVWNWGLALNEARHQAGYKPFTGYELTRELTALKKLPATSWLSEISKHTLAKALSDLWGAYQSFYRKLRAGLKAGFPKFKAKYASVPAFYTRYDRLHTDGKNRIHIEKIGYIKYKSHLSLNGLKLLNPRIKFEAGKWLLKCVIEADTQTPAITLSDVCMGIDVGVKSLAVLSFGGRKRVFKNINRSHKLRRLIRQLKHSQRTLERKQKGSHNRTKARSRVKELYGRIKRIRHDYIQQVTSKIVAMRPKVIVLEDLNISGMLKNSHISRAVSEQNLYMFREVLERKALNAGIAVKFADMFYPSSKTCSGCGHVREKLLLSERVYVCPECGLTIDRDFNAARNLQRLAE